MHISGFLSPLFAIYTVHLKSLSVACQLRGFCTVDHSDMVPHMLHTENSTQVDIILDHIQTNQTFSNSRFAIELLAVGGGDPEIPMFIDPKKSLDDEHTPGIFEVTIIDPAISLLLYFG